MNGVINGAKWDECTDIDELNAIPLKSLGKRHYPISHGLVLESFLQKAHERELDIVSAVGLLNRDSKDEAKDKVKYIYIIELAPVCSDYTFKLGFINYNNKERALTGIAGESVFVCSNECFDMFSGLVKSGKRKHTKNMKAELEDKINDIFNYFDIYRQKREREIDMMKLTSISDRNVGSILLDLHRNSSVAGSMLTKIVKEWDNPSFEYDVIDSKTMWMFLNACTHCIKQHKNPLYRIEQQKEINDILKQHMGV